MSGNLINFPNSCNVQQFQFNKELEATSPIIYTFMILQAEVPCVYPCTLVNSVKIQISNWEPETDGGMLHICILHLA